MWALAQQQPGFLGVEHAGDRAGSITLSYWESEAAIAGWKRDAEHLVAQRKGRGGWYARFMVRVARVGAGLRVRAGRLSPTGRRRSGSRG